MKPFETQHAAPKLNQHPTKPRFNETITPLVADLKCRVREAFSNAKVAHLQTIFLLEEEFLSESRHLNEQGKPLQAQIEFFKVFEGNYLTSFQDSFDHFTRACQFELGEFTKKRQTKVIRKLSIDEIAHEKSDQKAEIKAKASRRLQKSFGLKPSVKIRIHKIVHHHFNLVAKQRLAGIIRKRKALSSSFFTAWSRQISIDHCEDGKVNTSGFHKLTELHNDQKRFFETYVSEVIKNIIDHIESDAYQIAQGAVVEGYQKQSEKIALAAKSLIAETNNCSENLRFSIATSRLELHLQELMIRLKREVQIISKLAKDGVFIPAMNSVESADDILNTVATALANSDFSALQKVGFELKEQFEIDQLELTDSLLRMQQYASELPSRIEFEYDDRGIIVLDTAFLADFVLDHTLCNPLLEYMSVLSGRSTSAFATLTSAIRLAGFTVHSESSDSDRSAALVDVLIHAKEASSSVKQELATIEAKMEATLSALLVKTTEKLSVNMLIEEAASKSTAKKKHEKLSFLTEAFTEWRNRATVWINKYGRLISTKHEELVYSEFKANNTKNTSPHARLRSFVESISPDPNALKSLPFYYQQLFIGKHAAKENLFHSRHREMAFAQAGLEHIENNSGGGILVLGDALSGRTFFCDMLCLKKPDAKVFQINAPIGGSVNPTHFWHKINLQIGSGDEESESLDKAPLGSIFLINDLELWWERHPDGWGVIQEVIRLIELHGKDYTFIANMNTGAFKLLRTNSRFTNAFISIIPLTPFTFKRLEATILNRHRTGGLTLELDGIAEDQVSKRRLNKQIADILEFSEGNVGAALHLWLGHLKGVTDDTIKFRTPKFSTLPFIAENDWYVAMAQIMLHKQMTTNKLARILYMELAETKMLLSNLKRSGLIDDMMGATFRISTYAQPHLLRKLKSLQLI